MIIDTSALVAVSWAERESESIRAALLSGHGLIPAPVLVEFRRVTSLAGNRPDPLVESLLLDFVKAGVGLIPFDVASAEAAAAANSLYGSGSGNGGRLNMLDLMVYGVAKVMALPILCTGKDFAATDAVLHPASRPW
nr:type II toxin-antitoxin system VapC family toxin [Polymorphobacter sp.]